MISDLKASDAQLTDSQRDALAKLRDTDCYLLLSGSAAGISARGGGTHAEGTTGLGRAAALATTCKVKQGNMGIYLGPIEMATARQAAYVCWNGTKAWYTSGNYMNCWVTTVPGYGGEATWCGVLSGNHTATLTLRHDFKWWTWAVPFANRYGYANTRITKTGGVSASGFCCN
jgi:hypothetical protein